MIRTSPFMLILAAAAAISIAGAPVRADDVKGALKSLFAQPSLTDTPDGPKAQLRRIGVTADVWMTQFYQGQISGDGSRTWRYGGKMDAFFKLDAEKLGLWRGFRINAQYEHYFGDNINARDFALLPVNAAQAFIQKNGYHSALSLSVTQQIDEHLSVSVGKFNMLTLASQTPLVGGGGIDTFMNRAFAAPSTGIGVTSPRSPGDRLVAAPPYLIGGIVRLKTAPIDLSLMVADPRNAQNSRVIEHPFEKGFAIGASATIPTVIAGLRGYHTIRGAFSNVSGFDLEEIPELRPRTAAAALAGGGALTKKGFRFASYAIQQNFFQSEADPALGWGLFTLATLSDGNPSPIKWSMLVGLGGNNLVAGRENDRWGVGFYHFGPSHLLLEGLAARRVNRSGEGGVEAYYNLALTPWLRLSGDLQVIDPWNPSKTRAGYAALRLQTKF